tara:strand:+ start:1706 stop:1930 length:225 start_codon:yes stop_codon:yes gene_type:complete
MNSIDFCYWLQGFFELSGTETLTDDQLEIIKNHLNLAFVHQINPLKENGKSLKEKQEFMEEHLSPSANDTVFRC